MLLQVFVFMIETEQAICGGIDLGGTKIETALFNSQLMPLAKHRLETPTQSYKELLDALLEQIAWLRGQSNQPELPIGIGLPGLVDPISGVSVTSNLPANGHTLSKDLCDIAGGKIIAANDCKTFTLSEANGGAGAGYSRVFGLIIGTGLGGGLCRDGVLDLGANGLVGEVGHYGLPAHLVAKYDLPILPCGCGRMGCYETLVSGSGIARLAQAMLGIEIDGKEIGKQASLGNSGIKNVLDVWVCIAAELIHTIQLHLDPECIVLGGGMSKMDQLPQILTAELSNVLLPSVRKPQILKPKFGDSSGGRGAALLVTKFYESTNQ